MTLRLPRHLNHLYLPLLVLIFLLGAGLRIAGLGDQPLWIDEGFTYIAIDSPDLLLSLQRDVHPPLYFLMLGGWSALAGTSEFALRYPSLLLGVLSIALTVPLATEINRLHRVPRSGRAVALVAALLIAVSELGFYVAQEARSYSLHIVLAALSMWGFLRWLRTGEKRALALWLLAMTALLYTHYLGAWVGAVQAAYVLIAVPGRRRLVAWGWMALPVLAFSGWALAVILPHQLGKADSDATIDPSSVRTLLYYAQIYLTQQWALVGGVFVLGLIHIDRDRLHLRPSRAVLLCLLWIALAVALTFAGNLRFSILTSYRISQIMLPLALILAFGLLQFRGRTRLFLIAVIALYSVFSTGIGRYYYPWPQYASLISERARPGDVVLMDFKGVDFSMEYYLDRQLPAGAPAYSLRAAALWEPDRLYREITPAAHAADTVWVARWNDTPLSDYVLNGSGLVRTMAQPFEFQGITVLAERYDRPASDSETIARFANGMTLVRAQPGPGPLQVGLLWGASAPLDRDYTVSAFLLDASGVLVAQQDSAPQMSLQPTTTWEPDALIYDPRRMQTVSGGLLPPGAYTLGVKVYQLRRNGRIRNIPLDDGSPYAVIGMVQVP